jgi:hypothetical protein
MSEMIDRLEVVRDSLSTLDFEETGILMRQGLRLSPEELQSVIGILEKLAGGESINACYRECNSDGTRSIIDRYYQRSDTLAVDIAILKSIRDSRQRMEGVLQRWVRR